MGIAEAFNAFVPVRGFRTRGDAILSGDAGVRRAYVDAPQADTFFVKGAILVVGAGDLGVFFRATHFFIRHVRASGDHVAEFDRARLCRNGKNQKASQNEDKSAHVSCPPVFPRIAHDFARTEKKEGGSA